MLGCLVAALVLAGCTRRTKVAPAVELPAPADTVAAPPVVAPEPEPAPPLPAPVVVRPAPPPRPAELVTESGLDSALVVRRAAAATAGERVPAAEVGYYLDILEARLRQLRLSELALSRAGEELVVRLSARYAFEVGSDRLAPPALEALRRIGEVLGDYRATLVAVHGHTDASGPATVNQALSQDRALAVVRALSAAGVPSARLLAVGFGARRPVASNATREGQEANRRVELRISVVR